MGRIRFTSPRERRLWLWVATLVVMIYATLGQVPEITGFLRERGFLRISGAVVLALLGSTILVRWFHTRPRGGEIGVAIGVILAYAMAWARVDSFEERTHLFEYGVLAVLIHMALQERGTVRRPAVIAIAAASLLGVIDECIQYLLPNRAFDLRDIGFNLLAVFLAMGGRLAVRWARRRFGESSSGEA